MKMNELVVWNIRVTEEPNWQQLSFFFFYFIVRGFEEEDSLENLHSVLFCVIKQFSV